MPTLPLTLEQARAQGPMDEFVKQQQERYPAGSDPKAFDKLLGRSTKPGKQPKAAGRTSRPDRDAG